MAGMLAGVETARRRRIHQSIVWSSSSSSAPTLRPPYSFCSRRSSSSSSLFFANSSPSSMGRSRANQVDEKLGQLAREARERLDERLRAQDKSLITRKKSEARAGVNGNGRSGMGSREEEEEEESKRRQKKKGWGGMGMAKLGLRSGIEKRWEQAEADADAECAICLEELRGDENVVNLDCSHRFHSLCLLPWLHSHSLCPCCRTSIL